MALPSGLPQVSDLGALENLLGNNIVEQTLINVPFTTITNRAQIPDFSKDLKPRMGIERIPVQSLYVIQNEFGPNGEQVSGITNDTFNQIRLVGGTWLNLNNSQGPRIATDSGSTAGAFVEISFYGTGLNLLFGSGVGGGDIRASINGGTEGANLIAPTLSTVLNSRNYAINYVIPVVSGLTLGSYTVRLRAAVNGFTFDVNGFEVINASANIVTTPGSSIFNGKRLSLPTLNSSSYNSGFETGTLGTKGGRVLVYQKTDGTIGKAVTPTNASTAFLTAADHTNEDIVRFYNFREFGAGRADDFAILQAQRNAAFTLDDGTTTLVGFAVGASTNINIDYLGPGTSGYAVFTFVGTGVDLRFASSALIASYTYSIDGGTAVNMPFPTTGINNVKIASGLPYGTHIVRIAITAYTSGSGGMLGFTVYQPKKPTLPSGAIELADYNIMADYVGVANTATADNSTIGSGVLRKMNIREFNYVGTWAMNAFGGFMQAPSAWTATTSTIGSYYEYTFFGTGVELLTSFGSTGTAHTVQIDGVNYTGAAIAKSINSSSTWTPGTATWVLGGLGGSRLQITGLALATHTIRITRTTATDTTLPFAIDVITPIHSTKSNGPTILQNTLNVGSQGISDLRKLATPKRKLAAQSRAITANPGYTGTVFTPIPDMSVIVNPTSACELEIFYSISLVTSVNGQAGQFQVYINGVAVSQIFIISTANTTLQQVATDSFSIPVTAGTHIVQVYWNANVGGNTVGAFARTLKVKEV